MRGFLKLSKSSPIPALYFLLGELPIEGVLHARTLGLLHNIITNPSSTVHGIVKYILMMCTSNSTTWSTHLQLLCLKYGLPSPLSLLQESPPISKLEWSSLVKTRVTVWHEQELRRTSTMNSKMKYLNVHLIGLSGRPHPVLHNIVSTQDAKKLRLHLKFLTCDYMCNELLSKNQPAISAACELCSAELDSIEHVMVSCKALSEVRSRLYPELVNTVLNVQPTCQLLQLPPPPWILTQFILDFTSLNLPESYRIPAHNPGISAVWKISRDWCFSVNNERSRLLKNIKKMKTKTTSDPV